MTKFTARSWTLFAFALLMVLPALPGCIFYKTDPNAKLATAVDPEQATPDYWWNQPAEQHVTSRDFDKLWNACKGQLYVRLFPLDREQYRDGLITSEPVVSAQFFEPWRRDTASAGDLAESSLATIRRTVHFEVTRNPDGTFQASPKVLVERFTSTERRLTSITQYHNALSAKRTVYDPADQSGAVIASDYWYPLRRDKGLEKAIANAMRNQLGE